MGRDLERAVAPAKLTKSESFKEEGGVFSRESPGGLATAVLSTWTAKSYAAVGANDRLDLLLVSLPSQANARLPIPHADREAASITHAYQPLTQGHMAATWMHLAKIFHLTSRQLRPDASTGSIRFGKEAEASTRRTHEELGAKNLVAIVQSALTNFRQISQ